MKKKPLSPRLYLEALKDADPAFVGKTFLRLIEWQIRKGYRVFFNGGWYLRAIYRGWHVEASRRALEGERSQERLKTRGSTTTMSEAVAAAMETRG